ncbi:E3 ubiquitin-protein ligase rnf213-alpha-like [Sinocyclocheilus rhinocerous]|uniref:E3 ubiquitin-protein ligase rnf213-alpha-like n=1 Tax=Sinocyclocheilus rhinocerous TaxID=307959 RepID=UPI0007B81EFD|nr:PREDICTED: E3 ubiquitin-protein ligase rnf213-alpha-like [Sinocyclocheilus rhinocerous]
MKCPQCNHVSSEKAKFCCECGFKLPSLSTETAPDKSQESQSSSNIPHGTDKEKTESGVLDNQNASVSPTQSNEDINNSNPKKEKKHVSSEDSTVNAQHSQEQQNSDFADDQNCSESDDTESQYVEPPKRNPASDQQISPRDRLAICFHAVLSKDFKFIPNKDFIFIRAGDHIGGWEKNLVELRVSGDLGEHGLLVEGKYICKKFDAEAVSIPYKYVVYKEEDHNKYELHYEYIYKLDSKETTNRCLFVKSHLLNSDGEWHQYDDIICKEPSKDVMKRIKEFLWSKQRKKIIEGREIAGSVMLQTIFDLLRSWSKINLGNFFCQLQQFYEVYGNPFVFEKTIVKWGSLEYGEKDVSKPYVSQYIMKNIFIFFTQNHPQNFNSF